MRVYFNKIEDCIKRYIKLYGKSIIGQVIMGVMVYFMMMSLNLVNDLDGLWHPSNFIAGDWEISLGRALQRYADRARFGIVSEPFNTILTLILLSVGNVLIIDRLKIKSSIYKWLIYSILIANPIVCCSLSYSYMSVNFGLAYFFSVLAFIFINVDRKNITKLFLAACFLGISMAFYQAYICVVSVLIVNMIIIMILEKEEVKSIFKYIISSVGVYGVGGLVYLIITKFFLYKADVQMASYKGAANVDLFYMIKSLPNSIRQCYRQFGVYIFDTKTFSNLEFIDSVLGGLCFVYIIAIIIQSCRIFRDNLIRGILFLVMICILPVAACSVLLIAVGNDMTILMSMGMLLCIVLLGGIVPRDGRLGYVVKRIYLFVLLLFLWFQLSAVENDQLALKEGKTATISLTESIINNLYENYNLDVSKSVAFVGRPADNDMFSKSQAYYMANEYAMFGCWSTQSRNNRVSWNGVLLKFLGANINLCSDTEYEIIIQSEQVKSMPEYPADGSIDIINDIIVVKVSDNY